MPSSCCVPCCTSNYVKTDRVTVFKFPKESEKRKKWLRAIHRKGFVVTNASVVCIKHFDEKFIIRNASAVRPDGTILTIPRDRIKLTDDAYPTIFENQPLYMNVSLPQTRRNPAERKLEIKNREERQKKKEAEDSIISFEDFRTRYPSKLSDIENFYVTVKDDKICFVKVNVDDEIPYVSTSVTIKNDLSLSVTKENVCITESVAVKELLSGNDSCNTWTRFNTLLSFINGTNLDFREKLGATIVLAKNACSLIGKSADIVL